MVQRTSKYGTNRKIHKNKKHIVDKQIAESRGYLQTEFPETCTQMGLESMVHCKDQYATYIVCYTDNQHYEKVDKRERKKVYNKIKDKMVDRTHEDTKSTYDQRQTPIYYLAEKSKDCLSGVFDTPDLALDAKEKAKKEASMQKTLGGSNQSQYYALPPNVNRSLNYVKAPKQILLDTKIAKSVFVKNAGKKNCLYNGDKAVYKASHNNYDGIRSHRRAGRRKVINDVIKSEMQ